jgi:AraC family transcriptional regulator of adaptative response/methylated-DNA-[protein]-cysteine methyltransferase
MTHAIPLLEIAEHNPSVNPLEYYQLSQDYKRIQQALEYLELNFLRQPGLSEIAWQANLSEFHFQRLFKRWAGVSPKKFLQFLTLDYAKQLLEESKSLLEVTYETGLSGPARLHDLFISVEGVTPGEYKQKGAGLKISYGIHPTPFGEALAAVSDKGVCHLSFLQPNELQQEIKILKKKWEQAELAENPVTTSSIVSQIFDLSNHTTPLPLHLKGTNFQIKVWEALLKIPSGSVLSYEDIAALIGQPKASRAVASAVARNPIAYIIPCHRVIQKMGVFGQYHGGRARKKAILGWEAAQRDLSSSIH